MISSLGSKVGFWMPKWAKEPKEGIASKASMSKNRKCNTSKG
jgi:hypothetical protein